MKNSLIDLLFSNNFFLRFKTTFFELMLERRQLIQNLEDYYLEVKRQNLYILKNDFSLRFRDKALLLLKNLLTFLFCYIWKQLTNSLTLLKLFFALLRFVLICLTSPQFYLLFRANF